MTKKLGKRMNNCIETVEAYRGCPCASNASCKCPSAIYALHGDQFQWEVRTLMVPLTSVR